MGNATGTLIGALSSTSDGDVNGRKLFLSYWKGLAEDGSWNGTYQFAATPVYMGDQEGPISIFPTTLLSAAPKLVVSELTNFKFPFPNNSSNPLNL